MMDDARLAAMLKGKGVLADAPAKSGRILSSAAST